MSKSGFKEHYHGPLVFIGDLSSFQHRSLDGQKGAPNLGSYSFDVLILIVLFLRAALFNFCPCLPVVLEGLGMRFLVKRIEIGKIENFDFPFRDSV